MSHDLHVVLRRQPPADAFEQFADGHAGLVWDGSLGSEDNLAVSRAEGQDETKTSFIVYDGPADEVAFAKLLPRLRYELLIAVPFGRDEDDHQLAFSFSHWLADEYDGIVYAPDINEIVWPASRRGERAELPDDPDLV